MIHFMIDQNGIVVPVAQTGKVASWVDGDSTVRSVFDIPINLNSYSSSTFSPRTFTSQCDILSTQDLSYM